MDLLCEMKSLEGTASLNGKISTAGVSSFKQNVKNDDDGLTTGICKISILEIKQERKITIENNCLFY